MELVNRLLDIMWDAAFGTLFFIIVFGTPIAITVLIKNRIDK